MSKEFGQYLRKLRKAKGLRLRDLAIQTGIHFTYINNMESGNPRFLPSESVIMQIAQCLEVDGNEVVCMAGRIPAGFTAMMQGNLHLIKLVGVLSERKLSEGTYSKLLEIAKEN